MNFIEQEIKGVWIIEPRRFGDARGYFMESYKQEEFRKHVGEVNFVQDNESVSSRGVLRGLHFQKGEWSQAKLVRVSQGKVIDVAVDAAVGQQAHQMHRTAGLLGVFHRAHQCGIFKKAVVPDVTGDAGQLLIHHPACADVGVTHLAVAHLSVGQTHILTRAVHAGVGTGLKQPIQIGGLCRGDSIGPAGRGNAPAVQNH